MTGTMLSASARFEGRRAGPARPRWSRRFSLAWLCLLIAVAVGAAVAYLALGQAGQALGTCLLVTVPFVGTLIVSYDDRHPVGWIYLLSGGVLVVGAAMQDDHWAWQSASTVNPWASWAQAALWVLTFPLMSLALLWFPNGRLPAPRWRWVAAAEIAALGALLLASMASATAKALGATGTTRSVIEHAATPVGTLMALVPLVALTSVTSVLVRYRSAPRPDRDGIRWVALTAGAAVAVLLLVNVVAVLAGLPPWLDQLGAASVVIGIPVAIGVTILRQPTFDSRLVVARTLQWVLTGLIAVGASVVVAALFSTASSQPSATAFAAGSTAVAAAVAAHLRFRELVDRWLFGHRGEPLRVLSDVAGTGTGSPGTTESMAVALASSLKLTHLAIDEVTDAGAGLYSRVATVGEPTGAHETVVPLVIDGHAVGRLLVAPRSPAHPLDRGELQLVEAVADQIAAVIEHRHLAVAAQDARERLASARAEERRQLRRELHDGLAARLTGVTLQLATARQLLDGTGEAAQPALEQAASETAAAITDLRRVLDGLPPGPLEDLGLARAVDAAVRPMLAAAHVELRLVASSALESPQALPAAVELAAYRIVCEAAANVARHAAAARCEVSLAVEPGSLALAVRDDGRGSGGYLRRGGLGMASMTTRANDLGGSVEVSRDPGGGTVVRARLPVDRPGHFDD